MALKMIVKSVIKDWLVPPMILYVLRDWLWSLLTHSHFSTLGKFKRQSDRLFVLATGPSFNEDLKRYRESIKADDSMALNMFATSPLFGELKPRVYLLVDPIWFKPARLMGEFRPKYESLRETLLQKVSWEMSLIVPDDAGGSEMVRELRANGKIKVFHYNGRRGLDGRLGLWLLKKGLVAPPGQTVANTAAGLGVLLGYREVWMLGIDTSMHTMMRVDQETNEMYLENSHFYGTKKEKGYKGGNAKRPYSVAYFLSAVSKMFIGYERVRELADYCGVRVINASSFSWVDSLERVGR